MKLRNKNLKILKSNHVYSEEMEHDACGVGLVASTEGLKSRKVVEYGIDALKAVWHRGAIDADGKQEMVLESILKFLKISLRKKLKSLVINMIILNYAWV